MNKPTILVKIETQVGPAWTLYLDHTCTDQQEMQDYVDGLDPTGTQMKVIDLEPAVVHPVFGLNHPADIQKLEAEVLDKENRLNHLDAIQVLRKIKDQYTLSIPDHLIQEMNRILENFNG